MSSLQKKEPSSKARPVLVEAHPVAAPLAVTLTVDEFDARIERGYARALEAHTPPALLTDEKLAAYLDTSRQKIAELAKAGCPCIYLGDRRRFEIARVLDWLRARSTEVAQ